jgi:hypothetical protein
MAGRECEGRRPGSQVREGAGGRWGLQWRVVRGWRSRAIEATLDACAVTADGSVGWHVVNREAARENSRKQWKVQEARAREAHAAYVVTLRSQMPWAEPVGFDRWRRDWWKVWRVSPDRCIFETRRTADGARSALIA